MVLLHQYSGDRRSGARIVGREDGTSHLVRRCSLSTHCWTPASKAMPLQTYSACWS